MASTRSQWDGVALRLSGLSAYRPAWALQREIWERRRRLLLPDTLIVLEHEPVITIGKHGDERFLRLPAGARAEDASPAPSGACEPSESAEPSELSESSGPSAPFGPSKRSDVPVTSPEIVRIDRGGEVTYHGPGQITAYLIADLRAHDLGVRAFVHALEDAVLRTLRDFGIEAFRRHGLVGVWSRLGDRPAKVAAAGVRIERGVSLHGIALNVDGRCLEGFRWMVPCGLAGERVTTMAELLGEVATGGGSQRIPPARRAGHVPAERPGHAPGLDEVAERLRAHMGEVFGLELRVLGLGGPASMNDVPALVDRVEHHAARGARRPHWLRVTLPSGTGFAGVRRVLNEGSLCTVCEEARCPNRQECWDAGTATFLVLGSVCTRGCRFCAVEKGAPRPPDPGEPERVASVTARMGIRHAVVTSVTRDDLPDGGAAHFAATIRAVRAATGGATVEVLIPDLVHSVEALDVVLRERPDVLNHNIETVPRLYPLARPGADYRWSLEILRRASAAGLSAKSGFMIGLGESAGEIRRLLADLRETGCARVTIGQYLQPRRECLTVKRYYTPEEFAHWGEVARGMGFAHVESAPLVRSSYHAGATVG